MKFGNAVGRTFKVKIEDLLTSLKTNKAAHKSIVIKAQVKFKEMAIQQLEKMLVDAREGRKFRMSVRLQTPVNYTSYYDSAIGILDMTMAAGEETVEITTTEYEQFVLDRWGWSQQFRHSNKAYVVDLADEDEDDLD